MQNLKISIVQPDIIWENPKANLEKYSQLLDGIEQTDVLILPEMFTTGVAGPRFWALEKDANETTTNNAKINLFMFVPPYK